VDDYFTIGANTTVEFLAEVKLADYTTIGGTIVPGGDNITIINPRLDNSGIYAGGSGQNGISPTGAISNLKVFGGRVRNCARGNAGPKDGGKAFQFESAHSGVVVDGTTVESSFMGISTKRDFGSATPAGPCIFSNIVAKSCGILLFVRQSNGRSTTAREHSVILQNFQAQECGTFQGLIQLSRASGVLVDNGIVTNSTSIDSLVRGNHAFCEFRGLQYFGDATSLINLDPSDYAIDSSYVNENNKYDIKHQSGTTGYIAYASLATTNRTLQDCQIRAHLQNDVATKIVGDELRNAYCLLDVQQGSHHIIATTATLYLEGRTNFAIFATGLSTPRQNVTQLSFPATQIASTDPNTLDDYEENATASPITLTDVSGASLALTTGYADSTKIGRMVYVSFRVTYPATASGANALLGSLPVAAANNAGRVCCGLALRYTDYGAGVTGVLNPGASAFGFATMAGGAILTNANLSGKTVDGLLIYMSA